MGKVADIKTKPTEKSVEEYLNAIEETQKRTDSFQLLELFKKVTQEKPKMWGASLIGFGDLRYKSPATGREVDWFKIGFSPRKANISLHLATNLETLRPELEQLGKHKTGAGCLYINKLADVQLNILEQIVEKALQSK